MILVVAFFWYNPNWSIKQKLLGYIYNPFICLFLALEMNATASNDEVTLLGGVFVKKKHCISEAKISVSSVAHMACIMRSRV